LRPSRASRAFVHSAAALAVGAIALAAAGFPLGGSVSGTGGASRFTGTVFDLAIRLLGIACSGLGVWLLSNDMARASWKLPGLSRFMAASLLAGYLWLTLSGSLLALQGSFVAGEAYDAALHAFFLGFVFSMIFAHGPVIFPAILSIPIAFHPVFYAHLALLHLGVALRVAGDLTPLAFLRPWGGLLNAAAILLFLISTAARAAAGARARTAT
jgi:hypothetical protein